MPKLDSHIHKAQIIGVENKGKIKKQQPCKEKNQQQETQPVNTKTAQNYYVAISFQRVNPLFVMLIKPPANALLE